MSEIKNGSLGLYTAEHSGCNHTMTLGLKGLKLESQVRYDFETIMTGTRVFGQTLTCLCKTITKRILILRQELIGRWDTRTWYRSISLPLLRLTSPTEEFPWDELRKGLHGGQTMAKVQKWRRTIAESFNSLSRAHERHRRQTDDRRICYNKVPNVA